MWNETGLNIFKTATECLIFGRWRVGEENNVETEEIARSLICFNLIYSLAIAIKRLTGQADINKYIINK